VDANTRNDVCIDGLTKAAPADGVATGVLATDALDAAAALTVVLAAVKTLLRSERDVELPAQGIDLAYAAGVVATCRTCHLSWRVSRRNFSAPSWWSCPTGCRRPSVATSALETLNRA
jgi:hypothetical protein